VTDTTFPSNVVAIKVPYGAYDSYVASWTTYADKIVRLPAIPSTITVTVDNYLGELVSGASVTIEGNGQVYTGTTNESGLFVQGDLQPATYTVSVADMEGFKTPNVSEVVVVEDSQNTVTITYLEQSSIGEFSRTFSENSPGMISLISNEISANNMTSAQVQETYGWKIDDKISYQLTTGEEVTMRIIGFNHDTKSDGSGKAGITLEMTHCLSTVCPMNNNDTNNGGYTASVLYLQTMPTIKYTLPTEWLSVIKKVDKKSATSGGTKNSATVTTSEDLFLLSENELLGQKSYASAYEGNRYEYWKGKSMANEFKKRKGVNGSFVSWWTRSSHANDTSSFVAITTTGSSFGISASGNIGVSYAFCI
jgi:hypothetical protein